MGYANSHGYVNKETPSSLGRRSKREFAFMMQVQVAHLLMGSGQDVSNTIHAVKMYLILFVCSKTKAGR